jgi:hypothetical protein
MPCEWSSHGGSVDSILNYVYLLCRDFSENQRIDIQILDVVVKRRTAQRYDGLTVTLRYIKVFNVDSYCMISDVVLNYSIAPVFSVCTGSYLYPTGNGSKMYIM